MHGSPLSPWKDSDLWKHYDFNDYGIVGEAFLSIDFDKVFYYTDTGRSWDGNKFNVRDVVNTSLEKPVVRSTDELISVLKILELDVCLTVHPDRWHDSLILWSYQLVFQNIKNWGKILIRKKHERRKPN